VGSPRGRHQRTKTRQVLRLGSTVGMPPIFGLRGINAAEATAERESGVALNDHIDRCGADICGKAHAIDRAMRDSILWTSMCAYCVHKTVNQTNVYIPIKGVGRSISGLRGLLEPNSPMPSGDMGTCASLKIARAPFPIAAALRETQSTLESNKRHAGTRRYPRRTPSTRTPQWVAGHVPG
jgi:hypothetical protein